MDGKFVQRTNDCGGYLLMNAYFTTEVLQDSGAVLGVERDFGVTATVPVPATALMDDRTNDRKYFEMPTLRFDIQPQQLGDLTPPWARLDMEQSGQAAAIDNLMAGDLDAVVKARDNKDV